MLKDITQVTALDGHALRLRFEDGVEGTVHLTDLVPFEGVFAPLRDEAIFCTVELNRELGTIQWPNGADLDPDVLYAKVSQGASATPHST